MDCNGAVLSGDNIYGERGVRVYEDNVVIKNCEITNYYEGIRLDYTENTLILNNEIYANNNAGIYYFYSDNASIINNQIYSNQYWGFYAFASNKIKIINNNIYSNGGDGINLLGDHGTINNNIAYSNGIGIVIRTSYNNTLRNNSIENNNQYNLKVDMGAYHSIDTSNTINGKPIYYLYGQNNLKIPSDAGYISLRSCNNITISNVSIKNEYWGIMLFDTHDSKLLNSNFSKNWKGIHLEQSNGNQIINNTLQNNSNGNFVMYSNENHFVNNNIQGSQFGLELYSSYNNSIKENKIDSNYYGLYLSYSENNSITNNQISENDYGIYIPGSYIGQDIIEYNNILNNNIYSFRNNDNDNVSAENNWWGTQNKNEIELMIYDYYDSPIKGIIDYEPYLYGPFDDNWLPIPTDLKCNNGAGWGECEDMKYDQTLIEVRLNCTDKDGFITEASFELKNLENQSIIFQGTGTFISGYWIYDNDDLLLDYNSLILSATCTDNSSGENSQIVSWLPRKGLPNSILFYEDFGSIDSIQDNNGTIIGNIDFIETECDRAVDMTSNTYISHPLQENFPNQTNLTIEFWLKNTKLTSQGFFDIARLYGTNPNSMGIFYSSGVKRAITEVRNNATANLQAHAPGALMGEKWNHIAVTFSDYDRENNRFEMTTYFNGNPGQSKTVTNFYPNLSNDFWVGRSGFYGYSNAYIDEFKIFNFAKSDDEIYNDYLYMKGCTEENLPKKNCTMYKPESTGSVKINCSGLYVNNEPFTVKGVGYQPIPIGMTAQSVADKQKMYNDIRIRERDFPLLRAMGANTIRTWYQVLNKSFMDDLYNDGVDPIYVLMGFWINCKEDYGSASIRQKYIDAFTDYVNKYKDHPSVLAWMIGNENNLGYCLGSYSLADYNSLANELARIAYEIEGENYHPVAIVNGDLGGIGETFYGGDDESLNYTDFWGINAYRGKSFGSLFEDYSQLTGKPMVLTEYGTDALNNSNYEEMQEVQVDWNIAQWKEIENNTLGGTVMAYSDEWWKGDVFGGCGDRWTHDYSCGHGDFPTPDGWSNEEWFGVMRTVENPDPLGADIMEPRLLYYAFQQEWAGEISFNHSLYEGWNLISVPLDSSNRSLASVLSSIQGSYEKVFTYQNSSWDELDANDNLDPTMGFWIYMTKADTLSVEGYEIPPGSVWVYPGWNLVGHPYIVDKNVEDLYANDVVYSYNGSWSSYVPGRTFNSLEILKPGLGYWLKK